MAGAFEGLRAEVLGAGLSVDGYEVPYPTNEQILLLIDGKDLTLVRALLGDSWKAWRETNGTRQDIERFLKALWEAMGINPDHASRLLGILMNDDYCRALEGDLEAQGVDLRDLLRGSLSFRKLATLAEVLPHDSRLSKALSDPLELWSRQEYMLADVVDLLNFLVTLNHMQLGMAGYDKAVKVPKTAWERPGYEKPKPEFTSTDDAKAFFGALKG